jgi:hypothetical protein
MPNPLLILFAASILPLSVAPAPQRHQIGENNVSVRFEENRGEAEAREVLAIVVAARQQLMEKFFWSAPAPVEIRLSATTAEFCRRTGRPWWQASIYQNRVIHLQPVRVLRARGILATTLRHELMHQLVDEHTKGNGPRWLYEALAISNSGEIAFLKPRPTSAAEDEATWQGLEKRLQTAKTKGEFDRLYFQLYHLGQFVEQNFQSSQITALLHQLGTQAAFAEACRKALGVDSKALERRWRLYWTKTTEARK